jgi:anti-sigma B factor antagonist
MPLDLQTRKVGETAVVSVRGRVVFGEECNLLRDHVKELLPHASALVLNLEGVEYVDSGGVGTLVALFTSARNAGIDFKLACAKPRVEHVLKITKLLPILGLHPDEASAIDACRKHATA